MDPGNGIRMWTARKTKRENIRGEIQCVKRNGGDWWLQGLGAVVLRSSFSS